MRHRGPFPKQMFLIFKNTCGTICVCRGILGSVRLSGNPTAAWKPVARRPAFTPGWARVLFAARRPSFPSAFELGIPLPPRRRERRRIARDVVHRDSRNISIANPSISRREIPRDTWTRGIVTERVTPMSLLSGRTGRSGDFTRRNRFQAASSDARCTLNSRDRDAGQLQGNNFS